MDGPQVRFALAPLTLSKDHTFPKIGEQESKRYDTDSLRSQVPRRSLTKSTSRKETFLLLPPLQLAFLVQKSPLSYSFSVSEVSEVKLANWT
ncbi:hypothetical protein LguiA_036066 [Lonicera macranthoides]